MKSCDLITIIIAKTKLMQWVSERSGVRRSTEFGKWASERSVRSPTVSAIIIAKTKPKLQRGVTLRRATNGQLTLCDRCFVTISWSYIV